MVSTESVDKDMVVICLDILHDEELFELEKKAKDAIRNHILIFLRVMK